MGKTGDLDVRLQRLSAAARAQSKAAEDARAARDAAIGEAEDAGMKPAEISRATGLYPSQVLRILAAHTGRLQAAGE